MGEGSDDLPGRHPLRGFIVAIAHPTHGFADSPVAFTSRFQVRYEDKEPLNSRLIYAQITGYGEEGDDAEKPATRPLHIGRVRGGPG